MECKEVLPLLMGFLDGELDGKDLAAVRAHLDGCASCRNEEAAYRRLGEMTDEIEFIEPTETEWRAHWQSIYNRLERGAAWILLSIGAVVLILYGLFRLCADFLLDGGQPMLLRIGVGAGTAGFVVLAVSVARERIRLYRVDRYEEIEL